MSDTTQQLLKKFKSYKKSYLDHLEEFKDLAENGQRPETLIITCVDSRIDPAVLFNAALGEILVIRTKANIVPAYDARHPREQVAAVLEFAVCHLHVKNIIVMGHSDCGGINFLMNSADNQNPKENYITSWLEPLLPLKETIKKENPSASHEVLCTACEKANTIRSFKNLKTYPWIKQGFKEKTLELHGWYFNLSDCMIEKFEPKSNSFSIAI
jgi:carbonic anhydrase